MLVKFLGGSGGGGAIARYLTDPARAGREEATPEVFRGDIARTRALIDSIERKWTYTTGVLSFAPEDRPKKAQQRALMDDFERLAFAGLRRDQYDIAWVRHSHTSGGRVELRFLTPRMELTTGKAFNIAPPGWQHAYAPLRDAYTYAHGWARQDDPARARTLQRTPESKAHLTSREAIHAFVEARIVAGQITNRDDLLNSLHAADLETPRAGKSYITALDPETGERWRLKGRIYEQDWTRTAEFDRTAEQARGGGDAAARDHDPERAREARERLEAVIERRALWVRGRYRDQSLSVEERGEQCADRGGTGPCGAENETAPADSDRREDRSDRREFDLGDLADPRGQDRRNPSMDREITHAKPDGDRARALGRIRALGQRIRNLGHAAWGCVRAFLGRDQGVEPQTEKARRALVEGERRLGEADRLNDHIDREVERAEIVLMLDRQVQRDFERAERQR